MANVAVKLTYEDYLLFPEDDDLRHELIEGEHEVTPAPGRWHQHSLQNLNLILASFVRKHEHTRVLVYRLRGDRYDPPEELVSPAVLRTPLLPGLEIPLAELFG